MYVSEMVTGLLKIEHPTQLCEGCLVRKQSRKPYPTQANYRAERILELVHGDLCGPISPPTPSGNRYFFLLVDDYSRVMWVYMLKSKDETFGVLVENETGVKLKTFRSDHGGEFLSKQFTTYCEEIGLKRHFVG